MIRARRKDAGLSTRQFAAQLDTPQPRVMELEGGKTKNIDAYIAAVQALGGRITVEWD